MRLEQSAQVKFEVTKTIDVDTEEDKLQKEKIMAAELKAMKKAEKERAKREANELR